ncbi:alpha/beta fold hydrolase [Caballeronia glebae]|uniref:alpha/beta fold hydrolase n=1 Tax=Caballeronia glebae TaxID=1777143 RepID=UPI0038BC44E5
MNLVRRPRAPLHHALHAASANLPTLLLIHPLGADHTFWDACIDVWRGRIACLACDLRCSGASPGADEPPSIDTHVADLDALRLSLGIASVAPVGCAIGAMIAAAYAAAHPDATEALVLSNPAARSSEEAARRLTERGRLVQAGGMQAIMPAAVERPFLNQTDDARRRSYAARFAQQDAARYAQSVLGVVDADVHAELAAIRCPALVVAGEHDVLFPPDEARAVRDRIPGARYVRFDGAAHFVPYQMPTAFASAVLDFLADVPRDESTGALHLEQ